MNIVSTNIEEIHPYAQNAKKHPTRQVEQVAASIKEFGFNQPIVVDAAGVIVVGHGRFEAAKLLGLAQVPVVTVDLTEHQARAYRLADNKLNESQWDIDLVIEELKLLSEPLIELTGFSTDLLLDQEAVAHGSLADRFIAPPFSVLDTKQGYWQDRRRAWLGLGITSEIGRAQGLLAHNTQLHPEDRKGKGSMLEAINNGTSVFDPVLCEIAYSWFNVEDGTVLDPFAGGSVRGVVASKLGYPYTGIELRGEQVAANREQARDICSIPMPAWVEGDSNVVLDGIEEDVDLIFSCPPYADLEVYSTDPADISTMDYPDFLRVYRSIVAKACARLKENRFAVWVIGEVRNTRGTYYNFLGDTIQAFTDAGMQYYNEMVLVNQIGTLPLRAGRQFSAGRKVGKQHQNVLVFYKGDPRKIKGQFPVIDFSGVDRLLYGAEELSPSAEDEE